MITTKQQDNTINDLAYYGGCAVSVFDAAHPDIAYVEVDEPAFQRSLPHSEFYVFEDGQIAIADDSRHEIVERYDTLDRLLVAVS